MCACRQWRRTGTATSVLGLSALSPPVGPCLATCSDGRTSSGTGAACTSRTLPWPTRSSRRPRPWTSQSHRPRCARPLTTSGMACRWAQESPTLTTCALTLGSLTTPSAPRPQATHSGSARRTTNLGGSTSQTSSTAPFTAICTPRLTSRSAHFRRLGQSGTRCHFPPWRAPVGWRSLPSRKSICTMIPSLQSTFEELLTTLLPRCNAPRTGTGMK
mmetsp:Transcript_18804/g.54769  ORF Transcript_18804/g.54769 Transcript_18804/m.54769 type:complete len:216 (+) Transcript_18804:369-1016(+)